MTATHQPFFEIGRVGKSHGLKGEVKVDFILEDFELISELSLVYLKSPGGDMVPHRINDVRLAGPPSNQSFFVLFDKIDDRNKADSIRDCGLMIEDSNAEEWKNNNLDDPFIHYEVVDQNMGPVGNVTDIMETAAHLILICSSEAGEIMIPFVDEYILSVDDDKSVIHCMNLNQLME